MKILILGSEGFIGRHLVHFYSQAMWEVHGADLFEVGTQQYQYYKISRLSPEYNELLEKTIFDFCVNAAGSGNVPYSMSHPLSDFESNSLDTIRLLDGIRKSQPSCKYLHISSAAVYGNPDELPIKESSVLKPMSPYGWHKLIAENICEEYTHVFGLRTAIVRPFSVFGPGLKKQLFWDLYQKWVKSDDGTSIELWGTGNESRDFIFITDVVKAFNCIIEEGSFAAEAYNIGSGIDFTIKQVAEMFMLAMKGKKIGVSFNGQSRAGDPQNWRADISKMISLGYLPEADIETGIKKTTQWLSELK